MGLANVGKSLIKGHERYNSVDLELRSAEEFNSRLANLGVEVGVRHIWARNPDIRTRIARYCTRSSNSCGNSRHVTKLLLISFIPRSSPGYRGARRTTPGQTRSFTCADVERQVYDSVSQKWEFYGREKTLAILRTKLCDVVPRQHNHRVAL